MAIREDVIKAFQKDIDRKKQRIRDGIFIQARETYIRNKKRGDNSIVVEEWDTFQRERELKEALDFIEKNKNIKGELTMSKRRLSIRMVKHYNPIEVEVSEIESLDEYDRETVWALNEAKRLIDLMPDAPITGQMNGKPVKATPTEYVQAVQNQSKPANGVYTEQHVTTKYLKGKQVAIALKAINSGKITIDQVNNLQSWDEQQALLFPPRKY